MSNRNPLLQVKLTLPQKMVQEALPLLLTLIDARVLAYNTKLDISRQSIGEAVDTLFTTRQYEVVLNPPKGTVDNAFWAECVLKTAEKNNIPALIIRSQEGTSLESHSSYSSGSLIPQEVVKVIVDEVRNMTDEQVDEVVMIMRKAQGVV